MKSADPLDVFDRAIGEVIGSRIGEKQWFDASCRRAYDANQTAYHAWCRACSAEHLGLFLLARAEAQRVYGAARESQNEHTRNTLKHSPLHISGGRHLKARFLVRSLLFLLSEGPEVVWWWLLLRKRHSWALILTVSSVVSSSSHLCHVFSRSRSNSLAFRTRELLSLLLDLDTC